MFKITQNYGKVAAMAIQSVSIFEITNIWLLKDKKNVINKNIEKYRSQYRPLRNSTNYIGPMNISNNNFCPPFTIT